MLKKRKKVLTFGTFDLFHEGHKNCINQAKALGDDLYICIARDKNVEKHKGHEAVWKEEKRKKVVSENYPEAHVMLGFVRDVYKCISDIKPDVIALGYDQKVFTEKLEDELEKRDLKSKIVRLKSFKPDKFKTSILKIKE